MGVIPQPDYPKLTKVLVIIVSNRLSSLYIPSWHILSWHDTLFKVSYLLWLILKILDNGRNRNFEIFYTFFFFDSQRYHYWIVKSTEYIFKEFSKDIPTWLDNQVKLSAIMDIFWDFLIFYWILFSPQVKRLVVISNKLIYICCITSCRKIFGN